MTKAKCLLLAAIAVFGLASCGNGPVKAHQTGSSSSLASTQDSATTGAPDRSPPVPAVVVEILRDQGTDLELQASDADPVLAVEAAKNSFAQTATMTPSAVSLAIATVHDYGIEKQVDPSGPSDLELLIDHRLVWVVVFNDWRQPVFGPSNPEAKESPSHLTAVPLVVLVDAKTNGFLRAETAG